MFRNGTIQGVVVRDIPKHVDERGWLSEVFRADELDPSYVPVMGYVSMTAPDVVRGPHEHVDQSDHFAFLGPSDFKIYLWDNRSSSPTFGIRQVICAGGDSPRSVIIPPGIVHAYKNIGGVPGMVLNFPNRLFAGEGKKNPVDEIRHESDPASPYRID
jgi:dTDP-4-dehydrorhamnose 3,5-epimerase